MRSQAWISLNRTQRTIHLVRGLAALHPDWVFCGVTAAVVHGLSVPFPAQQGIEVAVMRRSHSRSHGIIRRRVIKLPAGTPVEIDGILVTDLAQTTVDCLRHLNFRQGLAIADSSLRTSGHNAEELADYLERHARGKHGIAQARMTASHANPLSENGGESTARAVMHELGFAPPELQVPMADPLGSGHVYRPDFRWNNRDGSVTLGELDGIEKYVNPAMTGPGGTVAALAAERRRESRLTAARVGIARFSFGEVANVFALERILVGFKVERDHEPLIRLPRRRGISQEDRVPLSAYGLD